MTKSHFIPSFIKIPPGAQSAPGARFMLRFFYFFLFFLFFSDFFPKSVANLSQICPKFSINFLLYTTLCAPGACAEHKRCTEHTRYTELTRCEERTRCTEHTRCTWYLMFTSIFSHFSDFSDYFSNFFPKSVPNLSLILHELFAINNPVCT